MEDIPTSWNAGDDVDASFILCRTDRGLGEEQRPCACPVHRMGRLRRRDERGACHETDERASIHG